MSEESALKAAIKAYTGGEGAKGALRAREGKGGVVVTGAMSGARRSLELDLGGTTLIWRAALAAAPGFPGQDGALIELTGEGAFHIAKDGRVSAPEGTCALRHRKPPRKGGER
jgi:hypothetical protein